MTYAITGPWEKGCLDGMPLTTPACTAQVRRDRSLPAVRSYFPANWGCTLHERAPALRLMILALHAAHNPVARRRHVAGRSDHGFDDRFGCSDRERGVCGETASRPCARQWVKLGFRAGARGSPTPSGKRFLRIVAARREHDFARSCVTDGGPPRRLGPPLPRMRGPGARPGWRTHRTASSVGADPQDKAVSPARHRCRSRGSARSPAWGIPRSRDARR